MSPVFTNKEIAKLLREIAAAYEIKDKNRFRVSAYNKAADSVEHASMEAKDLWDEGRLDEIPGVGKNIAAHLDELFRTGKVKHFTEVKKGVPAGMFNILDVPGMGPKTAYKLAKELKIGDVDDLKNAAEEGKIAGLKGFGEQSQNEILKGVREYKRRSGRILLPDAYKEAQKIIRVLERVPGVLRVDALGSLRRMVPTVGDIDLAVASDDPDAVVETFVKMKGVKRVLAKGSAKASVVLSNNYQVDLRVQSPKGYGAQLQYFTGSKNHNIHLRKVANEMGLSLSEYGIKSVNESMSQGVKEFPTEEEFYEYLGMDWIPPELREDTGEIEAAMEHQLPDLVELEDIKGDLHLHCIPNFRTSHDEGQSSKEEIIDKAAELGYEYVCLGNHNPSVSGHNEQDVKKIVEAKSKEIEQLRYSVGRKRGIKLLNMFEIDLLSNKSLAISNEILRRIDVVVASVHSSMRQSRKKMTERVLEAIKNPYVHIIGHPTGRLLLEREGYELDWGKVFAACKEHDKILEINAHPSRLDLPDPLVREAVNRGVKLAVNTDAHVAAAMDLMGFGVAVARRGWAGKGDIVNTLPWSEFKRLLKLAVE